MKRFSVILALLVAILGARAEGPDDQYIGIYNLIQEADKLNNGGQPREALPKYLQAQSALQRFQKGYPDWNTRIVSFRLNYLSDKISALSAWAPPAASAAPPGASPAASPAAPSDWEHQLRALQDQVSRLQADKTVLEAKLKEALSVQPAAMDPRELARAEAQISDLQKENDLLKVSLAQEKNKPVAAPDTQALDEARQSLEEANRKLAEQARLAEALTSEKAALQSKLDSLAAQTVNTAELATARQALEEANRKLAEQTRLAETLTSEKAALQSKLDSMAAQTVNTAELETARQALEEANRKLAEQTRLAEALASEKAALQSKLDNLPAQPANTAELETARQALEEANRKLAEQTRLAEALTGEKESLQARVTALRTDAEAAAALRAENQLLKKQVADLQAAPAPASPAEELNRQLAQAQAQIAALQSDTEILRLEKSALADRVKQLSDAPAATAATTRAADAARIKELERERDDLRRSLAVANKELYSRKGRAAAARLAGLEQQLATLRARLQVYEARQVPYTAEELALFRRPEPRLEQPVKRASRASAQELPAGTVALVAEAQRLHANREYAKAEEKYLQVLQQDRNNAPTLANLAAIELDQNHLAAAETNIMQAIALAPEDAFSQFVLGRLRFVQANYDEALDALSRAARLDPQDAQIQNFLGLTLSEKGLRGPAETALRKAIQLDPGYGNAHHNLAVIYLTQQPPLAELARWHYQKALAAGHSRNANLEKMIEARSAAPAP